MSASASASHTGWLSKPQLPKRRWQASSGAQAKPGWKIQAMQTHRYEDDHPKHVEPVRAHRTVYDQQQWSDHRSSDRYLGNIQSIPKSCIIRNLAKPLAWCISTASAACLYEEALQAGVLPPGLPDLAWHSAEPEVLTSFALSLLLVFRTNSSYARWDDARKMWGGITNKSRDLMRLAVSHLPEEDTASRAAMARWIVAFCRSLQVHLQEEADITALLLGKLPMGELTALAQAEHRPLKVLSLMSQLVARAEMEPWQRLQLGDTISTFYDAVGGCERILRTPIPLSYTRHTCRCLLLWLTFLPFGMWHDFGAGVVPITAAIGLLLLGIEEIGVQIEEPFGILPLDSFCARIEKDIAAMEGEQAQLGQLVGQAMQEGGSGRSNADAAAVSCTAGKASGKQQKAGSQREGSPAGPRRAQQQQWQQELMQAAPEASSEGGLLPLGGPSMSVASISVIEQLLDGSNDEVEVGQGIRLPLAALQGQPAMAGSAAAAEAGLDVQQHVLASVLVCYESQDGQEEEQ